MSERKSPEAYRDFDELMDRLQGIVKAVRSKDATIEESLDLLEEGIALGLRATDLVEKPPFTEREKQELARRSQASRTAQDEGAVGTAFSADQPSSKGERVSVASETMDA